MSTGHEQLLEALLEDAGSVTDLAEAVRTGGTDPYTIATRALEPGQAASTPSNPTRSKCARAKRSKRKAGGAE